MLGPQGLDHANHLTKDSRDAITNSVEKQECFFNNKLE